MELQWVPKMEAFEVTHVVKGDIWDETASGPMARLGMAVRKGDLITAINRVRLSPEHPAERALQNMANKEVFVTMIDATDSARRLTELMAKGKDEVHGKQGKGKAKKGKQHQDKPHSNASSKGSKKGKEKGNSKAGGGGKKPRGPVGRTIRTRACDQDTLLRARYRDWVEANAEKVHLQPPTPNP